MTCSCPTTGGSARRARASAASCRPSTARASCSRPGCVGIARAAYEYAVAYARERVQFGKPIIEHQAVGFRLADAAMRIDAARLLTWQGALRIDAGERATREAAMAKVYASEVAMFATWAAVQTLGGFGLLARVPGREVVPRREARGDLGGHVRHPAADHRARSGAGRA